MDDRSDILRQTESQACVRRSHARVMGRGDNIRVVHARDPQCARAQEDGKLTRVGHMDVMYQVRAAGRGYEIVV